MMRNRFRIESISLKLLISMVALALLPLLLFGAYTLHRISSVRQRHIAQLEQLVVEMSQAQQSQAAVSLEDSLDSVRAIFAQIEAEQNAMRREFGIGALLLAIGVGILALILSQRVVNPICQLTLAAQSLAKGDFALRIPVRRGDEIGELARSFNEMGEAIRHRVRELSLLNDVSRIMASTLDLNTLLHDLANHLAGIVDGTGCFIVLWDEESKKPVAVAAYGEYYDEYRSLEVNEDEPSAARVAILERRPLVIPDVDHSPFISPHMARRFPDKSLLVVPLVAKDRAIGAALIGDNRQRRVFTSVEVDRATVIARQAALAIENARLHESTQQHLHDLSLLYQASATISTMLDEQMIYDMAVQSFAKVFDVAQAGLIVFDEDHLWGHLVTEYRGSPGPVASEVRIPLKDNASLEWIEASKRPLAILDAQNDPLLASVRDVMISRGVQSILLVPLILKGEVIGTIGLDALDKPRLFSAQEVSLAQTLANQIAGVVENARLYRQMAEEKRKFELAAVNMGEGLLILDRAGSLLFANPQARAMLRLSDPALGEPLGKLCPQPELLELLRRRENAGDSIIQGEMSIVDGTLRELTLSLAPVRDETGALQWWVMVIHDITRLKELDRLKSEFISTVSHELRTPLASIMGFAEMILTRQPGPLTAIQDEFMRIIYESSEQLLHLVNDLLDVARMEAGRFELQPRSVAPSELLRRLATAMQPFAERKKLTFRLDVAGELPVITADPRRLEQVLDNLLSNAFKFTPEGGEVTLSVRLEDGSWLKFMVADTGIGIPPQDMDKLFTKFYQSAEVVRKAIGGTGLGLYIAKSIIEAHGGRIGAESSVGKGTTVWFTLPVNSPPQSL